MENTVLTSIDFIYPMIAAFLESSFIGILTVGLFALLVVFMREQVKSNRATSSVPQFGLDEFWSIFLHCSLIRLILSKATKWIGQGQGDATELARW